MIGVDQLHVERLAALPRYVITAADLCKARDAGSHVELQFFPFAVELELIYLVRPGPTETHVPAQYIPELGQFVEAGFSEKAAGAGDTGIVRARVSRTILVSQIRSVVDHAAELQDWEGAAVSSESFLPEEDRAGRRPSYRQCADQKRAAKEPSAGPPKAAHREFESW